MSRRRDALAPGPSSRDLLLVAFAALAYALPALADVTVQEKTVSTGLMGFGNGTSTTTLVIAGDRSRRDAEQTYTGRFQSLAGGGKPRTTSEIVRLDREVIWSLDPEKKEYVEQTFAEMREAMAKATAQMQKATAGRSQSSEAEMEYKVDVRRTGKREKVNGFDAENVIVTLTAQPKAPAKQEESKANYSMKMDQWLTPAMPGQVEVQAYWRRWAEKMGLDAQMQRMGQGMAAQYGAGYKVMAEKLKDLKGYPVRTTMTMGLGMQLTPEHKAELEKAHADAEKQKATAKTDEQKEDAEAKSQATASLAKGNLGGALGGMLGRKLGKSAEKKADASMPSESGDGSDGGIKIVTDVLSVSTGASGASFEPPAGYKKVERKK